MKRKMKAESDDAPLAARLSRAILAAARRRRPKHRPFVARAVPAVVLIVLKERRSKSARKFGSRVCDRLFAYRSARGEAFRYDELDDIMAGVENFNWGAGRLKL
ncbi:MAG: hypothetical protein HY925_01590 [Elusimicrobia bacterium]|nr:hypothetical protein [Elusimicrobiota bacterium]